MTFMWCAHYEQSPPDEDGTTICLRCGIALPGSVLTRQLMEETIERVKRQGYHSMRCVPTDEGWCCADDCPSRSELAS